MLMWNSHLNEVVDRADVLTQGPSACGFLCYAKINILLYFLLTLIPMHHNFMDLPLQLARCVPLGSTSARIDQFPQKG